MKKIQLTSGFLTFVWVNILIQQAGFCSNESSIDDIQSTLTKESCIALAYSQPAFRSVGKLNIYSQSDELVGVGTAVLLNNKRFCLTAGHCVGPNYKYQVTFELESGELNDYKVRGYAAHPDFDTSFFGRFKTYNPDIAVLDLGQLVLGIDGLAPNYDFGTEEDIISHDMPILTYVGHIDGEEVRQAVKSPLKFINYDYTKTIYSEAYLSVNTKRIRNLWLVRMSQNLFGTDFSTNVERSPYPYERMAGPGISGGLTWHEKLGFIGIVNGLHTDNNIISLPQLSWELKAFINSSFYVGIAMMTLPVLDVVYGILSGTGTFCFSSESRNKSFIMGAMLARYATYLSYPIRPESQKSSFEIFAENKGNINLNGRLVYSNKSTPVSYHKEWIEKAILDLSASSQKAAEELKEKVNNALKLFQEGDGTALKEIALDDEHHYQLIALGTLEESTNYNEFVTQKYLSMIKLVGFCPYKKFAAAEGLYLSDSAVAYNRFLEIRNGASNLSNAELGLRSLIEIANDNQHPCRKKALSYITKMAHQDWKVPLGSRKKG